MPVSDAAIEAFKNYAVTVVQPHLKFPVQAIGVSGRNSGRLAITLKLRKADFKRVSQAGPDQLDLESSASALLDRLGNEKFGTGCRLRLREQSGGVA